MPRILIPQSSDIKMTNPAFPSNEGKLKAAFLQDAQDRGIQGS